MSINSDLQTTGLLLGAKQTPFQQEQDQFSDFLRTLQTERCARKFQAVRKAGWFARKQSPQSRHDASLSKGQYLRALLSINRGDGTLRAKNA